MLPEGVCVILGAGASHDAPSPDLSVLQEGKAARVRKALARITQEPLRHAVEGWSQRTDSNRRPAVYETAALPLSYVGSFSLRSPSRPFDVAGPSRLTPLLTPTRLASSSEGRGDSLAVFPLKLRRDMRMDVHGGADLCVAQKPPSLPLPARPGPSRVRPPLDVDHDTAWLDAPPVTGAA